MQRLLKDAEAIKAKQGEVASYSVDSYADIVEAIHVVQSEMGITGTTAEEAGSTISGSLGAVKGAWSNLLTALASNEGVDEKIETLFDTIGGTIENMLPRIETALSSIPGLIQKAVPIIIQELPGLAEDVIPDVLSAAGDIITSVIDNLPSLIESVSNVLKTDEIPKLISNVVDSLIDNIDEIIDAGVDLFDSLLDNVVQIVDNLAGKIGPFLDKLVKKLTEPDFIAKIVEGGVDLLTHLIDDVSTIVEGLTSGINTLVERLIELLTDPIFLARLTLAGTKLGLSLVKGVFNALENLNILAKIPIIGEAFKGFDNLVNSGLDAVIAKIDEASEKYRQISEASAEARRNAPVYGSGAGEGGDYSSGGRGFTININGDVKAEDVADEIENRLAGKMAGKGVSVR